MFDAALASAVHRAEDHHGHIRQIEIVTDLFEGHYEAVTTVDEAFAGALLGLGVYVRSGDMPGRRGADGGRRCRPRRRYR